MEGRKTEVEILVEKVLGRGRRGTNRENRMQGAVVIPIVSVDDESFPSSIRSAGVLFTLRTKTVATHKGQVSFPGGKIEPGEAPEKAALRETCEELGIPEEHIRILGFFGSFPTATSGWTIKAFIGLVSRKGITPLEAEVEEVFLVPLLELIEQRNSRKKETPPPWPTFFHKKGTKNFIIWGATGRILDEFLKSLETYINPKARPS